MLRLRQIAFAATDLDAAEAALTNALSLQLCYRDPNVGVFGLRNALFAVGDQFLEIVSPKLPNTTAGRLLAKRGSDCGYMVLFQCAELGNVEARIAQAGIRIVYDAKGDGIRGLHLHPRDVPGAIVSVDAAVTASEWPWAGPDWRKHVNDSRVHAIVGLNVAVTDPTQACATWANVLGVEPDGVSLATDDGSVRFVDAATHGGREGIVGLSLATRDRALADTSMELLGVAVRFVAG
jgi:hypothetical protein